jgi:L-alanine-DL-glutamate epimerase-like enolase superfamily enzyme
LKLMIGCMLESRLALGCSVHIAAGLGTFDFIDLDPHIDQRKEPFTGGPDFSAPFYSLSDIQKGLGFQKR